MLRFRRLIAMDGNNSLKSLLRKEDADRRVFDSKYLLTPTYVDHYAHEVRKHTTNVHPPTAATNSTPSSSALSATPASDHPPTNTNDVTADSELEPDAASASPPSKCTDNWKAASADSRKKMWSIFKNTGIFAAACRHGFILWYMDMIASGELYVYLLSVITRS